MSGVTLRFSTIGDAWSGRGNDVLMLQERESLCALGGLNSDFATTRWEQLPMTVQVKLVMAFRRGIDLGLACGRLVIVEADRQQSSG